MEDILKKKKGKLTKIIKKKKKINKTRKKNRKEKLTKKKIYKCNKCLGEIKRKQK